jgi:hypothetical protein
MLRIAILISMVLTGLSTPASAEEVASTAPAHKLLHMYQLFYLPFEIEFRPGREINTVLPYRVRNGEEKLLEAHELVHLDAEWAKVRSTWRAKSLLEFNPLAPGKSLRLTQRLVSHSVPVNRTAFDFISRAERKQTEITLSKKPRPVVAAFLQMQHLKAFTESADESKLNFFIVSASWCESSKEYRVLLETYFKKFPHPELVLHSVVIQDPQKTVFESTLLKELFPHPTQYSHDTIPRFLALEYRNGQPFVYEEGEALKVLYERFYSTHQGFLSRPPQRSLASSPTALDPVLSATPK